MKQPARQKKTTRQRAKPIQIYLSQDELSKLERLLRRRDCSCSELVRSWIVRADTAQLAAERARKREAADDDPRQLKIAGA